MMSRNEIRLDKIQQRLGPMNKSRQTQFDEYGYAIPHMHEDEPAAEEGTTLNAGFIATIVAASLTVGMGTFFFIGGETPDLGINWGMGAKTEEGMALSGSVLDPVCGKDWKADLPNTDQMYCYMTRQVYRLCDKGEFDALLATMKRYDKDYKVWHRKFMMATFKTIGKLQTQGMQLGMEAAKLDIMKGSDKGQAEQMNKVLGVAGNIMKPTDDMLAQRAGKVPEYQLETAALSLVKAGYITAKDMSRGKPEFLTSALKRAGKVKTVACHNRD